MRKTMKKMRYFLLSIATLMVILTTACSNQSNDNPSVTNTAGAMVISEASTSETTTAAVTTESEEITTTDTQPEETTIKTEAQATDTEVSTEPETTKVSSGIDATFAELTAPIPPDTSGDIVQITPVNVKESYDTSYGSEIACATYVLNYLGFNVDEPTLTSYLASTDNSLSYIPSSAIKTAIETYLADIDIQEYEVKSCNSRMMRIEKGYPIIYWITFPDSPQTVQCVVLTGVNFGTPECDYDDAGAIFYNPYDNSVKKYSDWSNHPDYFEVSSETPITIALK